MRRLAWIVLICGTVIPRAAPGRAQAQAADGVAALVAKIEKALVASDAAPLTALIAPDAPPDVATQFVPRVFVRATSRAVVKERDREPLKGLPAGEGYRLTVEFFTETGSTSRIVTALLDVRRPHDDVSPDAWRVWGASTLTTVEGLYRLAVSPMKQFAARGFALKSEDLTLTMSEGAVFPIETPNGTTGLVLLGRGQMEFAPAPQTEREQVKLFAGAETLSLPFETAYVRVNPGDFASAAASLTAMPVDGRLLQRARDVFTAESQKSFSLDLGDLSRDPWYLVPQPGDFLAEVRTRKGDLTYARSLTESEDVALFERAKGRDLSRYASPKKLQLRGRTYDEDDLTPYAIEKYDIDASIDPERNYVNATATLRLSIHDEYVSTMNVHLAETLNVTSVISPELGRLLHVRVRTHDMIVVNLPAAVRRGSIFTLVVKYSGRVRPQTIDQEGQEPDAPPRMSSTGDRGDFQSAFPPEPYYLLSGRAYWYPQGVFTGYASATMRITLPAVYSCVASGEPVEGYPRPVAAAPSPTQEFRFRAVEPVRYLAVVVSKLRTTAKDQISLERTSVSVNTEAAPRQLARGREITIWASDIVRAYSTLLDDAPYPSLSLAIVENATPGGHSPGYLVMLHQPPPVTPVAWRDDPAMFQDFPEFFLAHEIAHQWWGQAVGWENYHEQWLSEGFAQYFAALYAQQKYGNEKFVGMLKQFRRWALDASDQGPVYLGYRVGQIRGDRRVFRALVYNKGAAVLHMLRRLVGDELFFSGLRRFYRDQKFTKAGTEDLRLAFEDETGQPLARFFDRWIYQSRIPRIKVTSAIKDGTVTVTFRQPKDAVFDVPVTVTVVYTDGRMQDVMVPVRDAVVERTIPVQGAVRAVRVNRDYAALAEFDE